VRHAQIALRFATVTLGLLVATAACAARASGTARTSLGEQSGAAALPPSAIVRGIDHLFVTSATPEPLYRLFRDTLGLPEVYPFRSYDGFASGVVSMGNVLFEVVIWKVPAGDTLRTEFKGIALEPAERLPVTLARLRDRGLALQAPDSVMYTTAEGARALGYVNVPLDGPGGLPPASASIFINDNLGSPRAAARRRDGAEELARRGGGPLGVLGVQELILGVEHRAAALAHWRRLLESPAQQSGAVLTFPAGPAMRFVEAPTGAILEMVLRVRSVKEAERVLSSKGMLRREDGHVMLVLPAAGGLRIRLVQ
jgi:hypothetical protein